jgi:hypothetical protein
LEALTEDDYDAVSQAIYTALNQYRDPRCVNWMVEHGYRKGHVPVLFHLAHNCLRYSKGRVPSVEDLHFGVKVSFLLLLRTAQDVASCELDLAKDDRHSIYTYIASYVRQWTERWLAECVQGPGDVATQLEEWFVPEEEVTLPLPSWATCFYHNMFGITWGRPSTHNVNALKRSETVNATRAAVKDKFIAMLRSVSTLSDMLSKDCTAFL